MTRARYAAALDQHGAMFASSARFVGRPLMVALALLSTLVVGIGDAGAQTTSDEPSAPTSVVALGDSITRGFNACGFFLECTSRSWSVGDAPSTNGVITRFRAESPTPIDASNLSRSGAKAADLVDQAAAAVEVGGDLVTLQIGGNDACTSTVASMTSVDDFEASVDATFAQLDAGLPDAEILVLSIPDPLRLWEVGRTSWWTRTVWRVLDVCPSALAAPTDRSPSAMARRIYVQRRVEAFNEVLADRCDARVRCVHDDGASFAYPFTIDEVSSWDYFHPNTAGQAVLGEIGWSVLRPSAAVS